MPTLEEIDAELSRRGINQNQETTPASNPFSREGLKQSAYRGVHDITESMLNNAFYPSVSSKPHFDPNPFNQLVSYTQKMIPEKALPGILATAGAIAGSELPVPFAATGLAGAGEAAGQMINRFRQQGRGQVPKPFSPVGTGVAAGSTFLGAGLARATPFLFSNKAVIGLSNRIRPAIEGIRKEAQSVFGSALEGLDAGTPIEGTDLLKGLFSQVETKGGTRSLSSVIKMERAGERGFVTDLTERFMKGDTTLTASETQRLANILDRKPVTEDLADLAREKLLDAHPDVVPGMRSQYAQKIGDYRSLRDTLKPNIEDQIGFSERLSKVYDQPEFRDVLSRNGLGDLLPETRDLAVASKTKGFLRQGEKVAERAGIFKVFRGAK